MSEGTQCLPDVVLDGALGDLHDVRDLGAAKAVLAVEDESRSSSLRQCDECAPVGGK